jgi:hypothetical protein
MGFPSKAEVVVMTSNTRLFEAIEIDIDMSIQIRELSELLGGEMDFWSFVTGKVKDTGEFCIIVTTEPRQVLMKRMHLAQKTLYMLMPICGVCKVDIDTPALLLMYEACVANLPPR